VLQRMALLTGQEAYAERARSILRAVAPALDRQPSAFGRVLCAADRSLGDPIDVVVAGDPETGEARALREAAGASYEPDLVVTSVRDGDPHAAWSLYEGKSAGTLAARAFACRGYACDEPTGDPVRLEAQVRGLSRGGS
jgi:uncharacterized protein